MSEDNYHWIGEKFQTVRINDLARLFQWSTYRIEKSTCKKTLSGHLMKFSSNALEPFRLHVLVNISAWLKALGNYHFILHIKDINLWRLYCDSELKICWKWLLGCRLSMLRVSPSKLLCINPIWCYQGKYSVYTFILGDEKGNAW